MRGGFYFIALRSGVYSISLFIPLAKALGSTSQLKQKPRDRKPHVEFRCRGARGETRTGLASSVLSINRRRRSKNEDSAIQKQQAWRSLLMSIRTNAHRICFVLSESQ